jgi:hypothetical protein
VITTSPFASTVRTFPFGRIGVVAEVRLVNLSPQVPASPELISRRAPGVVVPIPTFPPAWMRIRSRLLVPILISAFSRLKSEVIPVVACVMRNPSVTRLPAVLLVIRSVEAAAPPLICVVDTGAIVPIPTFQFVMSLIRSTLFEYHSICPSAELNIPESASPIPLNAYPLLFIPAAPGCHPRALIPHETSSDTPGLLVPIPTYQTELTLIRSVGFVDPPVLVENTIRLGILPTAGIASVSILILAPFWNQAPSYHCPRNLPSTALAPTIAVGVARVHCARRRVISLVLL